jgi:hypothetical protein
VTLRTATPDAQLPGATTRMTPALAANLALPKIQTHNAAAALVMAPGARGLRLFGVEVTSAPELTYTYRLLELGSGSETTLAQQPRDIVVDRSYVHGTAQLDARRCITLNSGTAVIVNSTVSDCHSRNGDAQAIGGWAGAGPYLIENNDLQGSHEVIAFGGQDPKISGLVPSDITVRRNHIWRPMSWKGVWTVKNLVELKLGKRVLLERNVLENNWVDGQMGFAFVFWSNNQEGTAPWSEVSDVTVRDNVVRNTAAGFQLSARAATAAVPMRRIHISNNLVTGLGDAALGGWGRTVQVLDQIDDLVIVRNTMLAVSSTSSAVLFAQGEYGAPFGPMPTFVLRDNVLGGDAGVQSPMGNGDLALAWRGIPAANVIGNVIRAWASRFVPANNAFVESSDAIGMASYPADPTLAITSPFRTAGTNRSVPGVDMAWLNTVTSGVVLR